MEATVDKCLAFCQALVSSNQKFTFTLSIGKETFKVDNKELVASSCVRSKKKISKPDPERKQKEGSKETEKSLNKWLRFHPVPPLNKQLKRLL